MAEALLPPVSEGDVKDKVEVEIDGDPGPLGDLVFELSGGPTGVAEEKVHTVRSFALGHRA